jgi:O-antigen/teichoic acid export membrane protein
MLIAAGILPYLGLGLLGTWLVTLIFGQEWMPAGVMVQILAGLYFARFVVSPLTSVTQLTGHQPFALWFNVFLLIVTFGVFYGGYQTGSSYSQLLGAYALVYGGLYVFTYLMCLRFCSDAGQN